MPSNDLECPFKQINRYYLMTEHHTWIPYLNIVITRVIKIRKSLIIQLRVDYQMMTLHPLKSMGYQQVEDYNYPEAQTNSLVDLNFKFLITLGNVLDQSHLVFC